MLTSTINFKNFNIKKKLNKNLKKKLKFLLKENNDILKSLGKY